MNIFKKLYLKWEINRDEKFLISEGFRKAKKQELEVRIGDDYICIPDKKQGEIHLLSYEKGVDVREMVALVADDYPEITRRYLDNKEKLN